ncbi:MAG: Spy/CpxP family protein refolding chaperone [Geminicoccales bacterium]
MANVFFIAGAAYTFATNQRVFGGDDRIDYVAEQLALSDSQEVALRDLRRTSSERRQALRGNLDEMRQAMLGEIAKPEFDRAAVVALLQERSQERAEVFADISGGLHGFLASLNPEQREAFLAMAQERGFISRLLFNRRHR